MNDTIPKEAFQALQGLYQAQSQAFAMVKHVLEQLKKLILGSKREYFKTAENAEQLALGFKGVQAQESEPVATETISYSRKKNANHKGRQSLPDHLPKADR